MAKLKLIKSIFPMSLFFSITMTFASQPYAYCPESVTCTTSECTFTLIPGGWNEKWIVGEFNNTSGHTQTYQFLGVDLSPGKSSGMPGCTYQATNGNLANIWGAFPVCLVPPARWNTSCSMPQAKYCPLIP